VSGINRIPIGYLDLVGTQTGGKNPSQANEIVAPVVDMELFYAAQALADHHENFAHNAIADVLKFEIPSNEAWAVYTISFFETAPATTDKTVAALGVHHLQRGGPTAQLFSGTLTPITAGGTDIVTNRLDVPIIFLPGTEFVLQIFDRVGAGARTLQCDMLIAKFAA